MNDRNSSQLDNILSQGIDIVHKILLSITSYHKKKTLQTNYRERFFKLALR